MDWKYIKPIKSLQLIDDFEEQFNFKFPNDYKDCVSKNNGGRPSKKIFDTVDTKEHELASLLSFNRDDRETIWAVNERDDESFQASYIAFATDCSGNLICFNKCDSSIIFLNHETNTKENITNRFSDFINSLYSI